MKLSLAVLCLAPAVTAFAPSTAFVRKSTTLAIGNQDGVVFGGNDWKPDSEKMGSTDTGDYFPEGYDKDAEPAFEVGMGGSQGAGRRDKGPELPGMENLGADAVLMGGIEENSDIPADMEFIPSSVPDGSIDMQVAASGSGSEVVLNVAPVCMTFEDYFCAFSKDSHPSFSVTPQSGRMDRRGGEVTELVVSCEPNGQAGTFNGDLVINLPEDNSKICYKITAVSF